MRTVRAKRGKWYCTACENVEEREREVLCWECGKGEMVYVENGKAPPPKKYDNVVAVRQAFDPIPAQSRDDNGW